MNRPDDIPEWAWEKAGEAINSEAWIDEHVNYLHHNVARAILAAVEEENEACAKVAEKHFDLRHADKARFASASIAAAIRNRKGA